MYLSALFRSTTFFEGYNFPSCYLGSFLIKLSATSWEFYNAECPIIYGANCGYTYLQLCEAIFGLRQGCTRAAYKKDTVLGMIFGGIVRSNKEQ